MATVYGNTYTGDGYGEQEYLDYSVPNSYFDGICFDFD